MRYTQSVARLTEKRFSSLQKIFSMPESFCSVKYSTPLLLVGARHFFARAKRRQGWLEAGIRTLED